MLKPRLLILLLTLLATTARAQHGDYEQVDAQSTKAPLLKSISARRLSAHLANHCSTEEEKVRAFYIWITQHIRYDAKQFLKGHIKKRKPNMVLLKRKALCADYAQLFAAMCRYQGIEVAVVSGYSKGAGYEPDDIFYVSDHAWNAVRVDGAWKLIDLTFASGFLRSETTWFSRLKLVFFPKSFPKTKTKFYRARNNLFFFPAPQHFLVDHLPANPVWQLLQNPMPVAEFEKPHNTSDPTLEPFSDFASALVQLEKPDQLISTADSVFAFNCRNSLEAGIYYYDGGMQLLKESAGGAGNELLLKSVACFDTTQKLLQHSKEMLREDAFYKNNKNKLRHNLARLDMKEAALLGKRFANAAQPIGHKNKTRIEGFKRQNDYLTQEADLLSEKNIDAVANKKKESTASELEFNVYFNEMVKLNTDSLMRLSAENLAMYELVSKGLCDSLRQTLQLISNCHDSSKALTLALCYARNMQLDNYDPDVFIRCQWRQNQLHLLDSAMHTRAQTLQQLARIQDDMRKRVISMKKFARESARFLREIKMRSHLPGKEDSLYRAQFDQIARELMVIYQKNEVVSAYLADEAQWADRMVKQCKGLDKLLAWEKSLEEDRFDSRSTYIRGRYKTCSDAATATKKNASASKAEARKLMRTQSK